jgi:UV DNA damage endonuclease
MIRLGLCCKFIQEPIKFRRTTATALLELDREAALRKVSELCLANAAALQEALEYCAAHHIGDFRVSSHILPVKTHPKAGYQVKELPDHAEIISRFRACGAFACEHDLRLSFHPGQFTVLNSPKAGVVENAIADLEYHAEVAEWIGADTINIHGGGAYGDKNKALSRLRANLSHLSPAARQRLTLENEERVYSPRDLLPLCHSEAIPLVYDVHHHRCHPDGQTVAEATAQAIATWDREPLFHISSPREGWNGPQPYRHHDYIDPKDLPESWKTLTVDITVEVEAKAKEQAVLQLYRDLKRADPFLF